MKIYRFVKYNYNKERQNDLKLLGIENEGINLYKLGYISPSQRYRYINGSKFHILPNTFLEKEMTKYFFLSLSDTINFLNETRYMDLAKGLHFRYAILELDIGEDVIKKYLGVGFYGNNLEISRIEVCLSYQVLYDITNENKSKILEDCLNIYNSSYYKAINYKDISNLNIAKEEYNKYLIIEGMNELYPYLCFKLKEYKLLNPQDINWSFKVKDQLKDSKYYENINNIIGRKNHSIRFNSNFSQNELLEYTFQIIGEENLSLKKTLKKEGFLFREH